MTAQWNNRSVESMLVDALLDARDRKISFSLRIDIDGGRIQSIDMTQPVQNLVRRSRGSDEYVFECDIPTSPPPHFQRKPTRRKK